MPGARFRGRGQFGAAESRSGRGYIYAGRSVRIRNDNFELTWNGPAFEAMIFQALEFAFTRLSDAALTYMQNIVPVDTGQLRDSCYVQVFNENGRIRVEIGATMRYAVYVELGTSSHAAQPYIRPTFDLVIRMLPQILREEVAKRKFAG